MLINFFYCVLSVIFIDFNYEGNRAEKSHRSLDQVAYEDGSSRARTTLKDSYGNPVAYDTLEDVDAGRPSKNKNFNYVIPGYASGILEENETPTRSTNFDNQEARRINDDRIHFVDPQTSVFNQNSPLLPQLPSSSLGATKNVNNIPQPNLDISETPANPPINDPLNPENIHLPADPQKSEGVASTFIDSSRSRPTVSHGILPPIDDPLNPGNIHLPADPHKSEGVPATSLQDDRPTHGFLPPIDDPLNPGNIHLPADPQKSEGVAATLFHNDMSGPSIPAIHGLLPPVDDPLKPENIHLPSDPQASEGVSATSFQNDRSQPSLPRGILPPVNDPLNPENINLPSDPQNSEGLPSTFQDRNSPNVNVGLEPPQLPNIDSTYDSNPFLPPAVKTFNHPKTSTFNSNDGPVIITDDQISFSPLPSRGLQPPKDPQQDININFQSPTISSPIEPTTPKKFTGTFTGSLVPTTQGTLQQIPVVVVQNPTKVVANKYFKGTFGGPAGVLTSNQFSGNVPPTQASPQITSSTSNVSINQRFQGGFGGAPGVLGADSSQNTFTRLPLAGNVIGGTVERTINKYQGNFGGPSGVLNPFDNKA